MSQVSEFLGKDFERYRKQGSSRRFGGPVKLAHFDRDDLLAILGWISESQAYWRDLATRKIDR